MNWRRTRCPGPLGATSATSTSARRLDLAVVDREAVAEQQQVAGRDPVGDLLAIDVGRASRRAAAPSRGRRATRRRRSSATSRPARLGLRDGGGVRPQADDDVDAGVLQVQRVGVALRAVADDRDGLAVEERRDLRRRRRTWRCGTLLIMRHAVTVQLPPTAPSPAFSASRELARRSTSELGRAAVPRALRGVRRPRRPRSGPGSVASRPPRRSAVRARRRRRETRRDLVVARALAHRLGEAGREVAPAPSTSRRPSGSRIVNSSASTWCSANPAASRCSAMMPSRPRRTGRGPSRGGGSARPRDSSSPPGASSMGCPPAPAQADERDARARAQDPARLTQRVLGVGQQHVPPAAEHAVDAGRLEVDARVGVDLLEAHVADRRARRRAAAPPRASRGRNRSRSGSRRAQSTPPRAGRCRPCRPPARAACHPAADRSRRSSMRRPASCRRAASRGALPSPPPAASQRLRALRAIVVGNGHGALGR